jgi:deoxyribodipyrimidine photo-lyase
MDAQPALVWFRRDLRLHDNRALAAAVAEGGPVIPVFVWSPDEEREWSPGAASRWWLHHSLACLARELARRGGRLIVRRGGSAEALAETVAETGARAVFWNRRYEPAAVERDARVMRALTGAGATCRSFSAALLWEPWESRKPDGTPYQVFTAFWRACGRLEAPARAIPAPSRIRGPKRWPESEALSALELLPSLDWAQGLRAAWTPGEIGALAEWKRFLGGPAADYERGRDLPGAAGTSRLSPHLHFGEISVRRLWHDVGRRIAARPPARARESLETYRRQLGWREFAHHLLVHFPRTPEDPLRRAFDRFPWKRDPRGLRAWQRGETGYPIVDAGMRELWATGWMHNRVRMIVASFLVKHQLLSWQPGARWFWDTLVDADLANNTLGWQWSAGCGADAAPYFRIFNPVLQGRKFDPEGKYVTRWVPELAALPARWVHAPWQAPAAVLARAGVELGRTYPAPVVDHAEARARALAAFAKIR